MKSRLTRPSGLRSAVALLLVALALLSPGCLHWPGAPYMDSVSEPPERVAAIVAAKYPEHEIVGPVYRLHREKRWGGEFVTHLIFLADRGGERFRGEIDADWRLSTQSTTFVDRLPPRLHDRFFRKGSSLVPEGRIEGRVWVFGGPEPVYEFLFRSAAGPGIGRIDDSGSSLSAYHLR